MVSFGRALLLTLSAMAFCGTTVAVAEDLRSEAQQSYAERLWNFVQEQNYAVNWTPGKAADWTFGPTMDGNDKAFANSVASEDPLKAGSTIIVEHLSNDDAGKLVALTVFYRPGDGFDPRYDDWYWAHFLPSGEAVQTSADHEPYRKPGFVTRIEDGRLWILKAGSQELADFITAGELAKHVVRPGAGPSGLTVKAPDAETIDAYTFAKPGFVTLVEDGRLWVFKSGSKELADYQSAGELAKHVVRPGAGPNGLTVKGPDGETIDAYTFHKPGFITLVEDGRLWVFKAGSQELADYQAAGELAKHIVRPGAGPQGMTIKAPDAETVDDYLVGAPGFVTKIEDGRLWVFKAGSQELADYEAAGELAKHIVRPGAGPQGMTVKAPDAETIDAYLAAIGQ